MMILHEAGIMANENWHLSKTIPISFLVGIVAQTFILGWLIADAQNTIESNTSNIIRNQSDIEVLENRVHHHIQHQEKLLKTLNVTVHLQHSCHSGGL